MTGKSVTRSIEIAASREAVWRALTDATELVRWFPLEASVEPGESGSITLGWRDGTRSEDRIETWQPGVRLRHRGIRGPWAGIAVDYFLETARGKTVLRVVTSGFSEVGDWSEVVDSFGRGWDFELRGLRHYLERHPGRDRHVVRAAVRFTGPPAEAWRRLAGKDGWLGTRGLARLGEGDPYVVQTATGDTLSGVVHTFDPPAQFSGTVKEWNDALFRLQLWDGQAVVWLSTYGVAENRASELQRCWQDSLDRLAIAGAGGGDVNRRMSKSGG